MSSLTQNDEILQRLSRQLPHLRTMLEPDRSLSGMQLDSIDLVELLCAVDGEFGVRLSDDDFFNSATVGDLAELIDRRRNSERVQS